MHTHIYNNTNAGCVLHVHTTDNNVITNLYSDAVTLQNQEIIKALDIWEEDATIHIPIIENHAHIPTLGKLPQAYTGDSGAVLIRNHGITV